MKRCSIFTNQLGGKHSNVNRPANRDRERESERVGKKREPNRTVLLSASIYKYTCVLYITAYYWTFPYLVHLAENIFQSEFAVNRAY